MMRSPAKRPAAKWLLVRVWAKSLSYGLGAYAILGFGNVAGGSSRVAIITVLVIIAIPISGFTLNQIALTYKGRRVAATVEDVRALKQADATAFTQPFAAIMRRLPVRDVYPGQDVYPARPRPGRTGIVPDQHRGLMAPIEPGDEQDPGHEGESASIQPGERPAAGSFWASLTVTEQGALAVAARQQTFAAGAVLWRQNQHADHVIVIRSGTAKICIEDAPGERVIATRGPGDIVGERAALHPGSRSATVITATEVRAFVIGTEDFAAVVAEYPRVLDVLESQIYGRLTEDRLIRPAANESEPGRTAPDPAHSLPPWTGQNCSICITDITAFSDSSRDDRDRRSVRGAMYRMLTDAFNDSGIRWRACHREDRGDGALIIVPPSIPTSAVVDAAALLAAALGRHNRQVSAATRICLRVAIHVGPVMTDSEGVSGHAINQAARLVEAAPLKRQIAETGADLGLAASEFVYDTVISQSREPAELARYQKIRFRAKGSKAVAWMYLSGTTRPSLPGRRPRTGLPG
jgi:Cyclic nucleotide-binding domain